MAEQERKATKRPAHEEPSAPEKGRLAERGEKLKKSMDEIVSEIDTVLEENAAEFVKSYVQRGGE
jgi:ubiquitin-like protein Pup